MEFCSPDNDFLRAIKVGALDGLLLGSVYPAESVRKAIGLVPAAIGVCGGHKRNRFKLAEIESDDVAVGVMGAQHLLGKGFRNFGFVGEKGGIEWSQLRERGFASELAKSGHSAAVYEISWGVELQKIVPGKAEDGELNDWLVSQPRPLALMACNDWIARVISRCCLDLGLRVPEDIAILGVDNDDLSTAISNPPLSSVIVPWGRMGRAGARLLDRLLDGETIAAGVELMPPAGVVERASTGTVAIEDEDVRKAVRFIRENAGQAITVDDVVERTSATRRSLERKFRTILGKTLQEEMRRCHVERARVLLSQTNMSIKQIANESGFSSVTWFTTVFREMVGESPAGYRRENREN